LKKIVCIDNITGLKVSLIIRWYQRTN